MNALNSFVIHQCQSNVPKLSRLLYLKGLAENLNEFNLKTRLYNSRLPRQLRAIISEITKVPIPNEVGDEDEKLPRNQRKYCHLCPSRLKRKTAYLCHTCTKPVCLGCSKKVCKTCADKGRE